MTITPIALEELSADKPLVDPKDDKLGYAPFARHLADSMRYLSASEGFVIAINGDWGLGKSTLLEFTVHFLEAFPEDIKPLIVRFNPWCFSSHEDLTRRFLNQLLANFMSKWKAQGKKLIKPLGQLAGLVSDSPIPYASAAKPLRILLDPKQRDVNDVKEQVVRILSGENRRVVVVIDDIDRLTGEEIRHLFRVVKAVANFPNVIYLLAYDKTIVANALDEQNMPGEAYLEKIVQAAFDLPHIDRTKLHSLLFKKLDMLLAGSEDLFDENYWANAYFDGIAHFLRTPRHVIRLVNMLSVTYLRVAGEVNPVDFISIEALRVFCPVVYDVIRNNKDQFAGFSVPNDTRAIQRKEFHATWLASVPDTQREPLKQLVQLLFPKLRGIWGNTFFSYDHELGWRKQLRICVEDRFPIYFAFALPEGAISREEMNTFLSTTGNAEEFGTELLRIAGRKLASGETRLRAYLERLRDFTEHDIPLDHIPAIVGAFFQVGDDLLKSDKRKPGLIDIGVDTLMGRVMWSLLRRVDKPTRANILRKAISEGTALGTIVDRVTRAGTDHDKHPYGRARTETDQDLTPEDTDDLEKIAAEKIREAAAAGVLLDTPEFLRILYRWRDWTNPDEPRIWVANLISSDRGLMECLDRCLTQTYSETAGERLPRQHFRLDPQILEPFVDPATIIDRVRELGSRIEYSERQRLAARRFVREYELHSQGKDPVFDDEHDERSTAE